MHLEQFAKSAGVTLVECDKGWGGTIGYTQKDAPNSRVCGFRTKAAAYKYWLEDTFGKHIAKAVIKLLRASDAKTTQT